MLGKVRAQTVSRQGVDAIATADQLIAVTLGT